MAPENQFEMQISGIDIRKGLSLYAGNTDIYLAVLRAYADNTPSTLEKLKSVSEETLKDYAITVHALKGSSANVGAEGIRERAADMEAKARAGDMRGILALNDSLLRDAVILIENINVSLREHDSNTVKPRLDTPDPAVLSQLRQYLIDYDMNSIDGALDILDSAEYNNNADLIALLKNSIITAEYDEAIKMITDVIG